MKKGVWKAFDFGPESKTVTTSPIKACNERGSRTVSSKVFCKTAPTKRQIFNFYSKLIPQSINDLAVHPKKVQEVEDWFKFSVQSAQQKLFPSFLLLSGPTGSGKTATVNVICKQMGISISEWINPMDYDYESFKDIGQVKKFSEFLTESKWNSLFEIENNKKITLVKDFPNAVINQPKEFFTVLENCYDKVNNPVVFICTEASNSSINLTKTLFPDETMSKYNIAHISFNPCAPTLMKAALKRAQQLIKENGDLYKQSSSATIDAILATAMGDIRNVMNQLYFASLLEAEELPVVLGDSKKVSGKRKRTSGSSKVHSMCKDENLGLFHGLGRVLNPKRTGTGNSWRLACDVEKLVDEFSTQPVMFISFLFENYLKYFGDFNDAMRASEILSLSTTFIDSYDRQECFVFGLWVSVLGLMVSNEHRVSKWNQIRGPTKLKNRNTYDAEGVRMNSMDCFYYDVIKKTQKFHCFKNNF